MGLVVMIIGLLAIVYGTYRAFQERGNTGRFILWAALTDVGFAVLGYGLGGSSGAAGGTLVLLYHGVARYTAWLALAGLLADPLLATDKALTGMIWRQPVQAVVFALALLAGLGISPLGTPEGQGLVFHALATEGGILLAPVIAVCKTVIAWLTARTVLAVCLTPEESPVVSESALSASSDAEQAHCPTKSCASAPSCDAVQADACGVRHLVSHGVAAYPQSSAYPLALPRPWLPYLWALIGMGLLHGLVQWVFSWLSGVSPQGLPTMGGSLYWAQSLLVLGAFAIHWKGLAVWRDTVVMAIAVLAFLLTCVESLTPLGRLFGLIVTGVGAVVVCYSLSYIHQDRRKTWYWSLLLMTLGSLLGIVNAENTMAFSAWWEIMTWASFLLIAWECTDKAKAAAIKYVVLCGGAAYVMMPGLFALGGGLTSYGDMILMLPHQHLPELMRYGIVFAFVGFVAKAGLIPFHAWLPDAHPEAPSSISAPLSGVLTKMGVLGCVLVSYLMIGQPLLTELGTIGGLTVPGLLITTLGLATMAYGEWMALRQEDLKRMLAYSTMGQVGEIFTVLGIGTGLALAGSLAHVLNHALMKDLLFLCAGALILRTGSRNLADLAGLVRSMPWTVGCMSVGLLAVSGLPPFNGFISKYLMIVACMNAGQPFLAAALLAASLVGAVYYMRILRTLLLDPEPAGRGVIVEAPRSMQVAMGVLAGLCILFGLIPQAGLSLVTPVVESMTGVGHIAAEALPQLRVSWPFCVLLPIVGSLVPLIFRHDRTRAGWGAALVLCVTAVLVLLFGHDMDTLSYGMAVLIPAVGALNLVYAVGYMEHSHTQWRFYTFFLLMTGGLLGVATSTDLFSFFLFWEIMSSWTLYFAIAHEGTREALREGFKYFLFNVGGAAFLFLGVGIVVGLGGTGSFDRIGDALSGLPSAWGTAALALLAIGFCLKAAQLSIRIDWQMHPALAPTPVSGYISSVLLKIAVFGLVKLFLVFGGTALRIPTGDALFSVFHQDTIMYCVAWVGALTLLYSALQAMMQTHLKMVFIWSTVSQIGYMVLGVATGTTLGMAGGLLHMVNHVFFKDILFLMVGAVMFRTHADSLAELSGVGRRMPWTMFCFFVGALTAVGVPPTSGFTSKWLIYQALMVQGEPLLALLSLVGSVITLVYLIRFMHLVFFGEPSKTVAQHAEEAPRVMLVPMLVLAGCSILTGVFPGLLLLPINAALVEYGMPALSVSWQGVSLGVGAWNAPVVAVLMVVSFGGLWYGVQRMLTLLPVRETNAHACGHDASLEAEPMPYTSVFPALRAACLRLMPPSLLPKEHDVTEQETQHDHDPAERAE